MQGFRRASHEATGPMPRLCEICGEMMGIRSVAFAPKGSTVTYRCRRCETVALEFAPQIEAANTPSLRSGGSSSSCPDDIEPS